MSNRFFILPAIVLVILLYVTAQSSCSNKELVPYLGKWTGGFIVDSVSPAARSATDLKRNNLRGFIQVYATRHSFKMHLEGEQEIIDLAGNWVLKRQRLTLKVNETKIDDFGGADVRNPNRKFIPSDAIRDTYTRPIVLDLSPDKHRYEGLPMTMGNLIGRHQFTRDAY